MTYLTDCDRVTTEAIARVESVSVALAASSDRTKVLHITTILTNPHQVSNRYEITYVNPPERRLFTFEKLEDAVEKYNQL